MTWNGTTHTTTSAKIFTVAYKRGGCIHVSAQDQRDTAACVYQLPDVAEYSCLAGGETMESCLSKCISNATEHKE